MLNFMLVETHLEQTTERQAKVDRDRPKEKERMEKIRQRGQVH
jgi:hypothetical protein